MTSRPALRRLAGAYLNEDWETEYASDVAAVEDFAREARDLAARLPGEIEELLASVPDDRQLTRVLVEDLAMGYSPAADGLTDREWLAGLARQVRDLLRS